MPFVKLAELWIELKTVVKLIFKKFAFSFF